MRDKVKADGVRITVIGDRFRRGWRSAAERLVLAAILAASLLFVDASGHAAQQAAAGAHRTAAQMSAKAPSPFAEAEELLQQGSLEAARNRTEELIKLYPSNAEGYQLLGIICSEGKDFPSALQAFQHAQTLDPKSAGIHNDLGNVYLAQEKPEIAEREFRKTLLLDPTNRDGNFNLGLLLMAKKMPAEAIPHFLRVKPQDTATRFNLARAYLQAGKTADGLKVVTAISGASADDLQVHLALGGLLATERQWNAAQLEFEKANALQPETFEILFNLGQTYFQTGENAKAELTLNRALKLKPDSPETLYVLAEIYFAEKRSVDAMDLLVHAHKLAPGNTDIVFLLARASMSQNYFEDAIPLLESGLKTAPQRADIRAALGESYFIAGETGRAIEEFQKLVEIDPSARSYSFLGLSYRHLGKFDEAKKEFQLGLKKDPKNASCLFNLGYIDARQGDTAGAEQLFQQALHSDPNYSEALLELANLRITSKRYEDAAELLRRYVRVSPRAATGYYKLALVERNLTQMEASQRDLSVFQNLSKEPPSGPFPYQHLFDELDDRSKLAPQERDEQNLTQLVEEVQKHPDQPHNLYLLAETYLRLGKPEQARKTIAQLDEISAGDYRTQTGVAVLLARWHMYDEAIQHFQNALSADPESDDVKFDLADAYFRKGVYSQALDILHRVSEKAQQDDTYLALLGDVQVHLGDAAQATEIFQDAIKRGPDNDQNYLSLTLVELRQNDVDGAEKTLQTGLARIPNSGKILWGMGIVSALQGETGQAAKQLERAVDLLPEWPGSYSTLGVFYYQTGQIAKAREVLDRFKGSKAASGFDLNRIEEALSKAPAVEASGNEPMPMAARQQLLQVALLLADRTL
jgi:tetratricopeptide (TPR) repeat protein